MAYRKWRDVVYLPRAIPAAVSKEVIVHGLVHLPHGGAFSSLHGIHGRVSPQLYRATVTVTAHMSSSAYTGFLTPIYTSMALRMDSYPHASDGLPRAKRTSWEQFQRAACKQLMTLTEVKTYVFLHMGKQLHGNPPRGRPNDERGHEPWHLQKQLRGNRSARNTYFSWAS
eukprot:3762937-Amphidinium_carterae.1